MTVTFTPAQAAKECGVSRPYIQKMLKYGTLKASQEENGRWKITPQQLRDAGLQPGLAKAVMDTVTETDISVSQTVTITLEEYVALKEDRARKQILERKSTSDDEQISFLKDTLRAIEPPKASDDSIEEVSEEENKGFWKRIFS